MVPMERLCGRPAWRHLNDQRFFARECPGQFEGIHTIVFGLGSIEGIKNPDALACYANDHDRMRRWGIAK
jgi:hypothetical protein